LLSARLAQTERLIREYGPGFSRANLHDMRRFHDVFEIRYPPAGKSSSALIPQPLPVEKTTIQSLRAVPSDPFAFSNRRFTTFSNRR